jgi:hypothetical protein
MVDSHVRVERTGMLGELGRSIVAVPIGILLFMASFAVLFLTEGRTNEADVAEQALSVPSEEAGGRDGEFISTTSEITTKAPVGDPEYLEAGNWISVERDVEMFAWVERSESEERKKIGGGTERITWYTYTEEWTSVPDDSNTFDDPRGHLNPPQSVEGKVFSTKAATVGAWSFDATDARLPPNEDLSLAGLTLKGAAAAGATVGDVVYLGAGGVETPRIGDIRLSWRTFASGERVTVWGQGEGSTLVAHMHEGETRMFRVLRGGRDEALAMMLQEYKMLGWIGRGIGFFMMWIGMMMALAPLSQVMDVIPFLGNASRGLVMVATLPIALVLTLVTVVISMVLHSVLAMVIIGLLLAGWAGWTIKRKVASA